MAQEDPWDKLPDVVIGQEDPLDKLPDTVIGKPTEKKPGFWKEAWGGFKSGLGDVAGVGEAAMGVASGIPSWILSRAAIPVKVGGQLVSGGPKNIDIGKANELANEIAGMGTYQPKTEFGKTVTEVAMSPINALKWGVGKAGEAAGVSEEAMAGVDTATDLALLALPWLSKGVKAYVQTNISKGKPVNLDVVKASIKEAKDVPAEVKQAVGQGTAEGIKNPLAEATRDILKTKETIAEPLPSPTPIDPALKLMDALKRAKPELEAQEALRSTERGKRFGEAMQAGQEIPGEAGFHAQLGKLTGQYAKAEWESLRKEIGQPEIDSLFSRIEKSAKSEGWEKIETKKALAQIFGEKEGGGRIPPEKGLFLLEKEFGSEFVKVLLDKQPLFVKMKRMGLELANIPRAVMASVDFSFGLRQGVVLGARHPVLFAKAFASQFKPFFSEQAFVDIGKEIASRPTYKLMKRSRLALTELGKYLTKREERFQSSWAEKIPLVRASGRAYTAFANKLRADVFDHMVKMAEKTGRDPWKDTKLANDIANFVNTGSGRGNMWRFEDAATTLNATFFSPRLMASRFNLLNPRYYWKLDPLVRKEALQSMMAFTSAGMTVLGLAKLNGLEVGMDPRSADFGKIKIGNTRIDIWGGFQQYIRTAAQLIAGETKSASGKITELGKGYKPRTRLDVLSQFAEYKTAPVFSFAIELLKGRGMGGEEFDVSKEIASRFIPMVIQDVVDIAKDDPELIPLSLLGVFGVGLQTYKPTMTFKYKR